MEVLRYLGNLAGLVLTQSWTAFGIIPSLLFIGAAILWAVSEWGHRVNSLTSWGKKYARYFAVIFLIVIIVMASYSLHAKDAKKVSDLVAEVARLEDRQWALPDELLESNIVGKDIRLVDLARESSVIRNKVFEDCDIYGPCIVRFGLNVTGDEVHFDENPDFFLIITTNETVTGAIELTNCVLHNCRFYKVGLIGTEEAMERQRARITFVE